MCPALTLLLAHDRNDVQDVDGLEIALRQVMPRSVVVLCMESFTGVRQAFAYLRFVTEVLQRFVVKEMGWEGTEKEYLEDSTLHNMIRMAKKIYNFGPEDINMMLVVYVEDAPISSDEQVDMDQVQPEDDDF